MDTQDEVTRGWTRLVEDIAHAKDWWVPGALSGGLSVKPSVPVLERMLPRVLFVNLVAFLDEVLEFYMKENGIPLNRNGSDLNGRLVALHDAGKLKSAPALHAIRKRRNTLAHDSEPAPATWAEVEAAMTCLHGEFQHLSLPVTAPTITLRWERRTLP